MARSSRGKKTSRRRPDKRIAAAPARNRRMAPARVSRARLQRAHRRAASRRLRPRGPWRRRVLVAALVIAGVIAGAVGTALLGYRWFRDRPGPASGESVSVSWPAELDAREAAVLLADLGLTDSAAAMELYLRATEGVDCAVPGPHLLPSAVTPGALVAALCRRDDRPTARITIPEGFHRFAIATRLEGLGIVSRDAFLHASADQDLLYRLGIEPTALPVADTAEGFLFPATYDLPIDSEPAKVVERLVRETTRRWQQLVERHPAGWERLQAEHGIDRRGALTLASMVEKEAAVADERPLIASVFLNRLRDPAFRRLQSDPTAIYGCYAMAESVPACRDFDGRASGAINRDPANVYSTYVTDGLPPGAIANPGAASIEAVLAPADTRYLFFVAKGGGRHAFSETYEEHMAAVRELRAARSGRPSD